MALLIPVGTATMTQKFGAPSSWEPHCYHYGYSYCAFYKPSASYVYATHFHMGMDYAAPAGTPIIASEAGTVVYAGWAANPGPEAGGGYIIDVKVAGGAHYLSAHCSRFAVKEGAAVKRGQVIAYVGQTGTATGPHDHFQVFTLDGYHRALFYNPDLFFAGGSLASSPLIQPQTYKLAFAPYATKRQALIAAHATVYGYNPANPGGPVETFTAGASGSNFWVNGKTTVTWTPSPGPIPRGTFLHGDPVSGGVFKNLLVVPTAVKAADGKAW